MGTCRLCLAPAEMNLFFEDRKAFLHKFLVYTKLKIFKNDSYPQEICLACLQNLESIYAFIKQCEESDKMLRSNTKPPTIYDEFIENLKLFTVDDEIYEDWKDETKSTYSSDSSFDEPYDPEYSDDDKPITKAKEPGEKVVLKKPDYLCNICGEHFACDQRNNFRRHMMTHKPKDFYCDICPRKFTSHIAFENHKMLHNTGQLNCKLCDKQFPELCHVKRHMRYTHSTSSYPCAVCSKIFSRPDSLRTHMKKHAPLRNVYSCDFCQKEFSTKQGLITHVRNHTGERPFSCHYCDSSFSDKGYLPIHERLHTGQSPHKCPVCLKSFAQIGNMKSHFKFNHKESNYGESLTVLRSTQEFTKSSSDNVLGYEFSADKSGIV